MDQTPYIVPYLLPRSQAQFADPVFVPDLAWPGSRVNADRRHDARHRPCLEHSSFQLPPTYNTFLLLVGMMVQYCTYAHTGPLRLQRTTTPVTMPGRWVRDGLDLGTGWAVVCCNG